MHKEEVLMGDLASVMTTQRWKNNPESIMRFLFDKIKMSQEMRKYYTVLREERFSFEEMMLIAAELEEISDLRKELLSLSTFKAWASGKKKALARQERETLDLRRVCQYFCYSYIQAGGRKQDLLQKFMDYTYACV